MVARKDVLMSDPADTPTDPPKDLTPLQREMLRALVHAKAAEPVLRTAAVRIPPRSELCARLQKDLELLIDSLRQEFSVASADHQRFKQLLDAQQALQEMDESLRALCADIGE